MPGDRAAGGRARPAVRRRTLRKPASDAGRDVHVVLPAPCQSLQRHAESRMENVPHEFGIDSYLFQIQM